MPDRIEVNRKARTVVAISGQAIDTIPAGTEFIVGWYQKDGNPGTSTAKELGVCIVWNDEFEFIEE